MGHVIATEICTVGPTDGRSISHAMHFYQLTGTTFRV